MPRGKKEEKETLSLEQTFSLLEGTIAKLEQEDIPLEESFQLYQEGMQLLKSCNDKIEHVEKAVLKLNEKGELDEF